MIAIKLKLNICLKQKRSQDTIFTVTMIVVRIVLVTKDSCKGCWWKEGYFCYLEPVNRSIDGRSTKLANTKCLSFYSKRSMYENVIPSNLLIIASEQCLRR